MSQLTSPGNAAAVGPVHCMSLQQSPAEASTMFVSRMMIEINIITKYRCPMNDIESQKERVVVYKSVNHPESNE